MANFYAMNVARHRALPDIKRTGMAGHPLKLFVSAHAHYSFSKGAALLGIGTDNLIEVPVDSQGRMKVDALDDLISKEKAEGNKPFLVAANAGSTVFGAYDDFHGIADVCGSQGVWMHVDGAWGGSVVVSPRTAPLMAGVERADSVTWNPHKMMGIPLQCSAFLLKDRALMPSTHAANASYLFQPDKLNAHLDTGDKSLQCGRKVDALKLWVAWQHLGDEGYAERIDKAFANAKVLRDGVVRRQGVFRLVAEPMCTNVCFEFLPPSVRHLDPSSQAYRDGIHHAPVVIKQRMQERGSMMTGYQSIDGRPNFFRMIVCSPTVEAADMEFVLDEIEALGADL